MMRWLILAVLPLAGCAIPAAYVPAAISAGVSLLGIENQDALAFLNFTHSAKSCPVEPST